MSTPACTRARSPLALRARPPQRLARAGGQARAVWRAFELGASYHRARRLAPCGGEQ